MNEMERMDASEHLFKHKRRPRLDGDQCRQECNQFQQILERRSHVFGGRLLLIEPHTERDLRI
jgi:hypothetical protein